MIIPMSLAGRTFIVTGAAQRMQELSIRLTGALLCAHAVGGLLLELAKRSETGLGPIVNTAANGGSQMAA